MLGPALEREHFPLRRQQLLSVSLLREGVLSYTAREEETDELKAKPELLAQHLHLGKEKQPDKHTILASAFINPCLGTLLNVVSRHQY